jgi:transcriptional regulator with XRE-family HTH domain
MQEFAFRRNLSQSVRRVRRERGLTQRTLAYRAGITVKYLSRIELGLATPSALVAFRLCETLGSDLGQLLAMRRASERRDLRRIVKLLQGRSNDKLDRARRILVEFFR